MHEEILTLAETLSGASEDETQTLALFCTAAEALWRRRLRGSVTPEECREAFLCAAALEAAAAMAQSRSGAVRFTAGDVSVTETDGGQTAAALRREAERLMEPYAAGDGFAVLGVRG